MKIIKHHIFIVCLFFCVFLLTVLKADELKQKYNVGELYDNQSFVIVDVDSNGNLKKLEATAKGILYDSKNVYGIKNLKCNVEKWIISRGTCVSSDYMKEFEELKSYSAKAIEELTAKISNIIEKNNYVPIETREIKNYNEMKNKTEKALIIAKDISLLFDNTDRRIKLYEEKPASVCVYAFSNVMIEEILLNNKVSFEDCAIGAVDKEMNKYDVNQMVKK